MGAMSWLGRWWRQSDHYDQLSAHLQCPRHGHSWPRHHHGDCRSLAVTALATIWTPTGPRPPSEVACALAACRRRRGQCAGVGAALAEPNHGDSVRGAVQRQHRVGCAGSAASPVDRHAGLHAVRDDGQLHRAVPYRALDGLQLRGGQCRSAPSRPSGWRRPTTSLPPCVLTHCCYCSMWRCRSASRWWYMFSAPMRCTLNVTNSLGYSPDAPFSGARKHAWNKAASNAPTSSSP